MRVPRLVTVGVGMSLAAVAILSGCSSNSSDTPSSQPPSTSSDASSAAPSSSSNPPASTSSPAESSGSSSVPPSTADTAAEEAARAQLVKAAQAEGQMTWYSTEAQNVIDGVVAAFTAKYGIKVTVLRLASTELLPRYQAEREAGQATADLFTYGSPEPFVSHSDWFVKLSPALVPGLAEYPQGQAGWDETNVLLNVTPNVIAYNTDLVKDPPKTWAEAADDKYKGEIVLTDPNGGRTYMGWANLVAKTHGIGFLEKLKSLDLKVSPTGGPGAQEVAAGGRALSLPNATTLVVPLKAQGAPIDYVIPNDPPTGSDLRANITSNAPHPNAAALFLDYRLSQESQNAVCKAALGAVASVRTDVSECLPLGPDFSFIDYFALTPEVTDPLLVALGLK